MSSDLDLFCRAMDGRWEVTDVRKSGDRVEVVYGSLEFPSVTWSHKPFHPELVPPVGTRGQIGFMWKTS